MKSCLERRTSKLASESCLHNRAILCVVLYLPSRNKCERVDEYSKIAFTSDSIRAAWYY